MGNLNKYQVRCHGSEDITINAERMDIVETTGHIVFIIDDRIVAAFPQGAFAFKVDA